MAVNFNVGASIGAQQYSFLDPSEGGTALLVGATLDLSKHGSKEVAEDENDTAEVKRLGGYATSTLGVESRKIEADNSGTIAISIGSGGPTAQPAEPSYISVNSAYAKISTGVEVLIGKNNVLGLRAGICSQTSSAIFGTLQGVELGLVKPLGEGENVSFHVTATRNFVGKSVYLDSRHKFNTRALSVGFNVNMGGLFAARRDTKEAIEAFRELGDA